MPYKIWNADALVILSDSVDKLRELERIAMDRETDWGGEVEIFDESHREDLDRTLGTGRQPAYLMTVWWD